MPFSFPSSPSVGATSTQNGRTYTYAGNNVWELAASGGSSAVRTFAVTNSGSGAYLIDGVSNPTLTLERGQTYDFFVNAAGHPFHLQTVAPPYSSGNLYTTGVTGSGTASGTIRIVVPYDAPSTLYYVCQFHGSMGGTVSVVNANEDAVLRALLVPPAPTGLTAIAGNAQATLSWTAPTGVIAQAPITDYVVQFSSNSGSSWTTFADGTSTATSYTVTGLTNGTAYTFRVAGVNAVGTGAYSTASAAVTAGVLIDALFSSVRLLIPGDTSTADVSSYSRSVTALGGAAVSTAQKRWGAGSIALGGSAWLRVPQAAVSLGSSDFVIECWFYMTAATEGYKTLWAHRASSSSTGGALAVLDGSSLLYFISNSSASGWAVTGESTGLTVPAAQWNHIAMVRSGNTFTLFLNGTAGAPVSLSGAVGSSGDFSIGAGAADGTQAVTGFMDDFRLTVGSNRGYTGSTITVPTAAFPTS